MALFTDPQTLTVRDLAQHESSIELLANAEGIDLAQKISLAFRRVGTTLQRDLGGTPIDPGSFPGATGERLESIVATDPIRDWLAREALLAIYEELSAGRTSARYDRRVEDLTEAIREVRNLLRSVGVGIVRHPIPRPQKPLLESVPGSVGPAVVVFATTLTNGWQEGSPSPEAAFSIANGNSARIRLADTEVTAEGFHVYAGMAGSALSRQTVSPLSIGAEWTLPDSGLVSGVAIGNGQKPDYFRRVVNLQTRG